MKNQINEQSKELKEVMSNFPKRLIFIGWAWVIFFILLLGLGASVIKEKANISIRFRDSSYIQKSLNSPN